MMRRRAIPLLLGALGGAAAGFSSTLTDILDPALGAAILLDIPTRRLIGTNSAAPAGRILSPPGSTLKPFVLAALLRRGKLTPETAFPCPRQLLIGNRRFDCTHPSLTAPVRAETALAYSCNCFVARAAQSFEAGELSRELEVIGLTSRTGLMTEAEASGTVARAADPDSARMQALGEAGIFVTPLEMALAYRRLALEIGTPVLRPILAGLEGAVAFGTGQNAAVAGLSVAGKTGTTRSRSGEFVAWFIGFAPSRAPETVVAVMLSGPSARSGGADAAPVAARIFQAHREGRL